MNMIAKQPPRTQAQAQERELARDANRPGPAIGTLVAEHPWVMVGAATGAGLAVGMHARKLAGTQLGSMLAATAGTVVMRLAVNALAQLFEPPSDR